MADEFLNPDGLKKRQLLIEHILRLLGMAENEDPAQDRSSPEFTSRSYRCRSLSAQSVTPTRVRCDERGITFTYGQVTWIGIQI